MTANNKSDTSSKCDKNYNSAAMALGAGIGVVIGSGVGIALGNIAFGAGIGVALGTGIGTLITMSKR